MHCLNLKITYQCTNKCSFCFSSYLANEEISVNGLINAIVDGRSRGCKELVISGGEPTLLPDVLEKALALASDLGYTKFIIQTNGSGLSNNSDLVQFLKEFSTLNDVCISFSIHGANAELHDRLCAKKGAFEKLIDGMRKISDTHCGIYTNTVISRLNIMNLQEIAELILPFRPKVLQFSMMHVTVPLNISTGLMEAVRAVRAMATIVPHEILRTEGIPYCLMHGAESCVGESFWPDKLDLYNKDGDYRSDFRQLDVGMRWKSTGCKKCVMDEVCMGIWKEHAQEFERAGIRPIS